MKFILNFTLLLSIVLQDSPKDAEEISDLIIVGELTAYKTDVWQFPTGKNCPLRSCHLIFDTRELAILHYTKSHAQHIALCPICKVPQFLLYGPHHLESHYKRKHPNANFPQKVKEIQVNTIATIHRTCFSYMFLSFNV